ncbi:hypothetical protein G9A89_015876 [Geosiphon pyriformis]|nr:hypothetical protein G9A89_015876 [Geosiphon pyriformis]
METKLFLLVSGIITSDAWKIIIGCQKFAGSLNTAFLVELTSSVCLATLKIAKFLVVSESGFFSAVVALHDVSLDVSAADIKLALSVFGKVSHVILKPADVWQYVVVYFKKLDTAASAFIYWYQEVNYLAVDCEISLFPPLKAHKVSKTHFVSSVSYAKTSVFLDFSEFSPLAASISPSVVVGNLLVSSRLASLESDLVKLSVLVKSIVKPVSSLVKLFEQFINKDLVSNSKLGLKVNEIMMHMGFFSKIVGKLEREVVFLKKECCIENVDMSGNSKHLVGLDNMMFSNLMSLWEHESVDVKANALKTAK